jgi:hypothetical protein
MKSVDKLEKDLKESEKKSYAITELYNLLKTFCSNRHDDSGSSGDMLNLDD